MSPEQNTEDRYLDTAYDLVEGSPQRDFAANEVENKLGADDDTIREVRRQLENKGLLRAEGADHYRLSVPAIHQVEEARVEAGRADEVEARAEERGDYVRTLYDLSDGDPQGGVTVSELTEELGAEMADEQRTREYLIEAELVDQVGDEVRLTQMAIDWVESR